jgi:tRNA(Ile2) C34 agmatinyltransferase TiaS
MDKFEDCRRNAMYCVSEQEWLLAVFTFKPVNVVAVNRAANIATVKCPDCRGTGRYIGQKQCFRCQGKGRQGQNDFKRNWGYDNFHRKAI